MRKAIVFLVFGLVIGSMPAKAQSITQLIEQIILDGEKLAAMKSVLQDMYNAYQIIDSGYKNIKNIVQGNFNLHKAFLDGLLAVNPDVAKYVHVADIINAEATIVSEYKAAYSKFSVSGLFTSQELSYMSNQYSVVFKRSLNSVDELTMVITADQLRMSDAERLAAIDRIYRDITADLNFLRSFNNGTSVQGIQRAKEAKDVNALKILYGL